MKLINEIIKDSKTFFQKYLFTSIFLNIFIITSTLVYQLGFTNAYYGNFIGVLFLFVFFFDILLILLNNCYLNKADNKGKRINWLTFIFLIYTIIAAITLMGMAAYATDITPATDNYQLFYHGIWLFALLITYIDYVALKNDKSGIFIWNKANSQRHRTSKKKTIILKITKAFLFGLILTTYVFAGILAFCLLTLGGPPIYGQLFNLFIAPFIGILIIIFPVLVLLQHKITYRTYRKIDRVLTIIGLGFLIIFSIPFIAMPAEILNADAQFAEAFGEDWNHFDEDISENFYTLQCSLIQTWFGEPPLDSDAWELDADNVFVDEKNYELRYDVYYPGKNAELEIGQHSTIIFIHGGAWILGDKTLGAGRLKWLAAQGYVCFSIEYRLLEMDSNIIEEETGWKVPLLGDMDAEAITPERRLGDFTIEDMLIDIGNFTQYLAKNEGEDKLHGADLDTVFFMGQSAGAHLAGVAGFGYNNDLKHHNWGFNDSLNIKGIVLFYPPNSAKRFFYEDHPWFYKAGFTKDKKPKNDPDFYDLYTPSELVDDKDPKCIIFQGTSDSMVPLINAIEIDEACKKEDVDSILIKGHFAGHAHDISTYYYSMTNYYLERFLYLINTA
ncbi:MAG: hypothetical protein ACTSR8_03190 [Promethearchaeota archaeon]